MKQTAKDLPYAARSHSELMKISLLHLVALASLMLSCEDSKPETVAVRPTGMDLPELVFALNAPPFQPPGRRFIEVLVADGKWDIQHMGKHVGFAKDDNELYSLLKKLRDLERIEGFEPHVLISAAGNTQMLEINKLVRTAAKSGMSEVYFLTRSSKHQLVASALSYQMPIHYGCGQPDFEPMFIHLQNDGRVYVGSGSSRQLLDQDLHDNGLPGLNGVLDIFSAAARSANTTPFCQFYYSEEATYQRFIDVLSRMHERGVRYDISNFMESTKEVEPKRFMKKPSSPTHIPPR